MAENLPGWFSKEATNMYVTSGIGENLKVR